MADIGVKIYISIVLGLKWLAYQRQLHFGERYRQLIKFVILLYDLIFVEVLTRPLLSTKNVLNIFDCKYCHIPHYSLLNVDKL